MTTKEPTREELKVRELFAPMPLPGEVLEPDMLLSFRDFTPIDIYNLLEEYGLTIRTETLRDVTKTLHAIMKLDIGSTDTTRIALDEYLTTLEQKSLPDSK